MKLSVSEIAKRAGVSVRTIQYYDRIGLLKPVEINQQNGYRYYDESSVNQLKDILHYKGLDFSLKEIPALISSNGLNSSSRLLEQRKNLIEKKKHIEQLLNSLDSELSESKKIAPWFDKILTDYNYSGFSYMHDEDETFAVWGMADYEKNIPFGMKCRFPTGYVYFHFIAFCVLLFEDMGLLNTDDYVSRFIPEFRYGDKVKIQHLLNMTSGISNQLLDERWTTETEKINDSDTDEFERAYSYFILCSLYSEKKSRDEIIETINYSPLKFTPGEQVDDIKTNYDLLTVILEQISGKDINVILDEYVFAPLDMINTSWGGVADVIGYYENKPIDIACSNEIVTTAEDLSKWCDALNERKLLSENGYNKFFSQSENSCGLYSNGKRYHIEDSMNEITVEFDIDTENGNYYFSARNKMPVPDNKDRVMYFPVICCDDGYVKLEVWEMQSGTEVKVNSIRVFDENANELYCDEGLLIDVRNDGEVCHAEEIADNGYYYELDLAKILGDSFDSSKKYVIEARAECPPQKYTCAQLGTIYKRDSEWHSMYYNVFYHHISAYDLFMEQLIRDYETKK